MIPRRLVVVVALAVPAYGGGAALDATPVAAGRAAAAGSARDTASGAIAGKALFSGTVPPPQRINLSADPNCEAIHTGGLVHRSVQVKDGGLADVLVYVKSGIGPSSSPSAEPVLLDQAGCEYHPHMIAVMVGQPLRIRNSDETLHNIHPRPTVNSEFNVGQPRKGMEVVKTFEKPELLIPTRCDVHPWMRAYISVLAHPYFAVTAEDGSYEIKGLPDGEYEVEAVHGQLKSVTGKVGVRDGKTSCLDLRFGG